MSSSPAGGSRVRVLGLLIGLVALLTAFALTSFASGAADTLKGGSVKLSLKSKGLKFSPKTPTLTITGGSVDPTNMSGTATVTGKTTAKHGNKKAAIQFTAVNFTGGGAGNIDAKAGGKKVAKCLTFSGGSDSRNGFDGTLSNGKLKISSKCAKQLKKSLKKSVKTSFGKVTSVDTVPSAVTLTGGSVSLTFDSLALQKLSAHGELPNGTATGQTGNGVSAIGPATLDIPSHTFTFPVKGGSLAPDLSSGQIKLDGGIDLVKVNSSCLTGGGVVSASCSPSGAPTATQYPAFGTSGASQGLPCPGVAPAGTAPCNGPGNNWNYTACNDNHSEIQITDLVFDAASKVTTATATFIIPISPSSNQTLQNAPLSTITTLTGTANPSARTFSANASLVNTLAGAGAENATFGSSATPSNQGGINSGPYHGCNEAANDFQPNSASPTPDPIGTSVLGVNAQ